MELKHYNLCVTNWADALYRFALKCTGQREDAQDIVQNAFEVLWQKRDQVDPGSAKAFLFQVVYNLSVSNYRLKGKTVLKDTPENFSILNTTSPDLKKVLDNALALLDGQSRALVLLKDLEGYNYSEIATIVNLNETQVKVYLHRARKTLKQYLVSVETVL